MGCSVLICDYSPASQPDGRMEVQISLYLYECDVMILNDNENIEMVQSA